MVRETLSVLEQILKEHDKTEKDFYTDVTIIQDWLKQQPHLPSPIHENKIKLLLLHCKLRKEKVKNVLDRHYSIRNDIPEIFNCWDPCQPDMTGTFQRNAFIFLPKLTPDQGRIAVGKFYNSRGIHSPWNWIKQVLMTAEIQLRLACIDDGLHYICDMENFTIDRMKMASFDFFKKLHTLATEAYCTKIKGIHILNAPSFMSTIFRTFQTMMAPKLFARIYMHENLASLHNHVPKQLLPKDYGGGEPLFDELYQQFIADLETHRSMLMNEGRLRSNESKRLAKVNNDMFGSTHGSFKKLEID